MKDYVRHMNINGTWARKGKLLYEQPHFTYSFPNND